MLFLAQIGGNLDKFIMSLAELVLRIISSLKIKAPASSFTSSTLYCLSFILLSPRNLGVINTPLIHKNEYLLLKILEADIDVTSPPQNTL